MSITPTNLEQEVKSVDIVVSKADEKGNITYGNPIFMKLSKYSQGELLDHPHAMLRHPDMPKIIFKFLWDNIQAGKEVKAFVKNLAKDGSFYWVLAHVKASTNPDGSFRNYTSTRRGMSSAARVIIEPLYEKLLEAEKNGGMETALSILEAFLKDRGDTLDTFNDAMQKIQNN